MKEANDFFNDLISGATGGLNVAKLGKVVKFYPETQSADVLPLPSGDNAIVLNAPLAAIRCKDFFVYYPLKPGDLVVILFCDNDTENIKLGTDNTQTERTHDITDAVVLGGFTLLNDKLNVEDKEALCIQNTDNTGNIVINKNGDVTIKAKHFSVKAERIDLN